MGALVQGVSHDLNESDRRIARRWRLSLLVLTGRLKSGRACPLCLGISDIDLFRYCQGIVYFDAEISDRVSTLVCS
jgi:hypothetical protein